MATKKTTKEAAAQAAATVQPTDRDPNADVQADPALADSNNPEATDGDTQQSTDDSSDGGQPAVHPVTEQAQSDVELVAMRREAPLDENGPTTADVHPDDVSHWLAHGWEITADAVDQA